MMSTTPFLESSKIKHEWFQSDKFVTVSIYIKNVPVDAAKVSFGEQSLSVSVSLPTTEYSLELDLAHPIIVADSKFSVLKTQIEVRLRKMVEGMRWGVLEGEDTPVPMQTSDKKPEYPSSSKKVPPSSS